MPCTGRMDPLFALKAFMGGADGVLVSGCHPNDCHYAEGNFYARRRLEVLKRFLPVLGIHEDRFHYTWVFRVRSAAVAGSRHPLYRTHPRTRPHAAP